MTSVAQLTRNTDERGHSTEWHEKRSKGIGGSDAGVLAGSPYKTPYALWLEKTGRLTDDRDSEAMYWGRVLEEPVARRYTEVTGRKVRRMPFLVCKERPWMLANVDRQIVGETRGPGILEVKTSSAFGTTVGDTEDLPDHYYAQLQHYLMVTGYEWGSFAWLVGGNTFRWFDVEADREYQAALLEIEERFWQRVLDDDPPPVQAGDVDTLKRLYNADAGHTIELDGVYGDDAAELVELKAGIKRLETQAAAIEARLKLEMGEAAVGIIPGWGEITWKSARPSVRTKLDEDALRADGLYEKYARTVEVPGSRRFLLKPKAA